ncbi:MAG: type I restriction-modification system subunit M N-terminal domain-containing protein, partial [Candidatus Nomurabacteria bacterium]|nr:type I restriction-modification system subunit M N-terminal domain-containing protein [Candidatus Nomurabacteria bacterium]
MDKTKESQRAELHKAIWQIANDLRGSVDGWDFKSYVLGFLFYRFMSDNLRQYINDGEDDPNFDYANLTDEFVKQNMPMDERTAIIHEKGYFILPSELFENVA